MEFRSNRCFFISEPFPRTLKNQFRITLGPNSATIFSNLNSGETLSEANQQGGFQVEEATVGGSKFGQNSDPVTPLPSSLNVGEFNSIPATSEFDPASEIGNPDELGFQTPTQANIGEFDSIPATCEFDPASEIGNPDEVGLQTSTQANIGEFNSIPATSELDPVSESGNPDEVGLQTPTQATVTPTVESSAESKKRSWRRKEGVRGSPLKPGIVEGADRPEWLPDDWEMVRKLRQNGRYAGKVDTLYYQPVRGRQKGHLYKSKTEVLQFLETGTRPKRKSKPKNNNGPANVMLSSQTMEFPSNEVFAVSELFPQTLNVPTRIWPEPDSDSLTAIDITNEANKEDKAQVEEGPEDGSKAVQNSQPQPKQSRGVVGTRLNLGKVEVLDQPEWLPLGWEMERKARENGAMAGRVDTFYYEPKKGLRFKSKSEALFFMETGTRKSRKTKGDDNSDSSNVTPLNNSASSEQNGSTSKRKKRTASKDNANPPEKVAWILNFDANGSGAFDPSYW